VLKRPKQLSTIIEWVVDVIIVGVLAAITIPRAPGNYQIGAAMSELATIKNALGMYQAENDTSAYPPTSSITSHADLIETLSPYISLPEKRQAAWLFLSYTSAYSDTFVLVGRAKDFKLTRLVVTPTVIDR